MKCYLRRFTMCGIWGFSSIDRNLSKKNIYQIMKELFLLSESRGKEAAGIAIASDNTISVFKRGQTASRMIRDNEYLKNIINLKKTLKLIQKFL